MTPQFATQTSLCARLDLLDTQIKSLKQLSEERKLDKIYINPAADKYRERQIEILENEYSRLRKEYEASYGELK